MVRPNPRYGEVESNINPELEKILIDKENKARIEANKPLLDDNGNQVGSWLPVSTPEPSWWVVESCDAQGCVPWAITSDGRFRPEPRITPNEAILYLTRALNFKQAEFELNNYRCDNNRNPSWCQRAQQAGGYIGRIRKMIGIIKQAQQEYQQPQQGGFDIIPQVFGEEETIISSPETIIQTPIVNGAPALSKNVLEIINNITNQKVTVPAWFANNNINWVLSGHITEQDFLIAYHNLIEQGLVTEITPTPTPTTNETITDNMVTQQIDYFTIENGRAIGQITFTATQNFNPFYYNKTITNLIQFKDRNGANILPTVKQNNLRFTATERTETIRYDEGMKDNIYSKVSSFVWSSARTPTAFSKPSEFEIREKEPVKPISSGFMGAGVAGAIAGLVLLGFIVDSKVGKR